MNRTSFRGVKSRVQGGKDERPQEAFAFAAKLARNGRSGRRWDRTREANAS